MRQENKILLHLELTLWQCGAVSTSKQKYKLLKFKRFILCLETFSINIKCLTLPENFLDLNQQKYVDSENLKYQRTFENVPKKLE